MRITGCIVSPIKSFKSTTISNKCIMVEWDIWTELITPEDNLGCHNCQHIYHKKCIGQWLQRSNSWATWKIKLDITKMQRSWFYKSAIENLEQMRHSIFKNINETLKCEQHQKESEHCWSDCNVIIWMDCIIEGKHINCKKEHVDDTIKRYKSCLNTKLDEIFEANTSVDDTFHFSALKRGEKIINDTINNWKLELIKVIDESQKELQNKLKSIYVSTKSLQKEHSEMSNIYKEGLKNLESDTSQDSLNTLSKTI